MAKAAPAPLNASLLGVPKGAAAPATELPLSATDPSPIEPPSPPAARSPAAAPSRPAPASRPIPQTVPPPIEEPRTALTVRLPLSTQERLREAAFRTRREKQMIVDEALTAWLDAQGY